MSDKQKPPLDDLEAVRVIVDALQGFGPDESERIIRWAKEKLGISTTQNNEPTLTAPPSPVATPLDSRKNIKSFIEEKKPKSGSQLAAVVAYYYAFEAPQEDRKDSIDATDLREACRQANVSRPKVPNQTLINASHAGYLDRAGKAGSYRINAVGENLVAMILPEGSPERNRSGKRPRKTAKNKSRK